MPSAGDSSLLSASSWTVRSGVVPERSRRRSSGSSVPEMVHAGATASGQRGGGFSLAALASSAITRSVHSVQM
jgi:hypothetical protein